MEQKDEQLMLTGKLIAGVENLGKQIDALGNGLYKRMDHDRAESKERNIATNKRIDKLEIKMEDKRDKLDAMSTKVNRHGVVFYIVLALIVAALKTEFL